MKVIAMKILNAIRMAAVHGGARAAACDGKALRNRPVALVICSGPGPFYPFAAGLILCYALCTS